MRAVVQRVLSASVWIEGKEISKIDKGVLVFVGFGKDDTQDDIDYMVKKIVNLRIIDDERGKMNLSVKDTGADVLVVSQFTLYGDVRWGNRPSFDAACGYKTAEELYNIFCSKLSQELGKKVKTGKFGAFMEVHLINHGPVTILIDSKRMF